jgi:hypothetical protein
MVAGMVVVVLGGACGRGSTGRIPAGVAGGLAARADHVATTLASGACDQALAEARSLQSDVAALKVDPALRDQAVAGAARLVAAIDCAPPTTTTTVPLEMPGGDKGPDRKKHKGDDHDH